MTFFEIRQSYEGGKYSFLNKNIKPLERLDKKLKTTLPKSSKSQNYRLEKVILDIL